MARFLTEQDINRLLRHLDTELRTAGLRGELFLVGGAVMCIAFKARESTRDLDAFFRPTREIREAAARVAARQGVPENWLNDAVKGYLSRKGTFNPYLELENLTVYTADARYLLAMKCLSARIGEEFHDIDDIRFLLRSLNLTSVDDAYEVIGEYYPIERFPQKTLLLLEELLAS